MINRIIKINSIFFLLSFILLNVACTRNIQVSTNMQMQNPPERKINSRVLVVISKEQAERVIVEKPGALSDYFSFEAGKSISMNLLNMMKVLFKEADFANEVPLNINAYDYYILADFKNYKIYWGSTAFSEVTMNLYIDYKLLNTKRTKILAAETDGSSAWRRSGGEVVALINPIAGILTTNTALGNAWDSAVSNSLSQWVTVLQAYFKNK